MNYLNYMYMHVIGGFCIGSFLFSLVYGATKLLTHAQTNVSH